MRSQGEHIAGIDHSGHRSYSQGVLTTLRLRMMPNLRKCSLFSILTRYLVTKMIQNSSHDSLYGSISRWNTLKINRKIILAGLPSTGMNERSRWSDPQALPGDIRRKKMGNCFTCSSTTYYHMSKKGILLVGHGSKLPYNKELVEETAEHIARRYPDFVVKCGFMN